MPIGKLCESDRNLEPDLQKWRFIERKHELKERIDLVSLRELLPKNQHQTKLKMLDDMAPLLK